MHMLKACSQVCCYRARRHRIGMGGQAVCSGGKVSGIVGAILLFAYGAREVKGCFEKIRSLVFTERVCSCLFFPCRGGKTTMLRDCCRTLSREGYNVSLIDERNEIAACCAGVPTLDLGTRCDVLAGCPRSGNDDGAACIGAGCNNYGRAWRREGRGGGERCH